MVKEEGLPLVCEEEGKEEEDVGGSELLPSLLTLPKTGARRNPWGNYSYAELITQVADMGDMGDMVLAVEDKAIYPASVTLQDITYQQKHVHYCSGLSQF